MAFNGQGSPHDFSQCYFAASVRLMGFRVDFDARIDPKAGKRYAITERG